MGRSGSSGTSNGDSWQGQKGPARRQAAPLRRYGTLTQWHEDRNFGYITPAEGGTEIFVHVSAFIDGERPELNEVVSFEVVTWPNGKQRAERVTRSGQQPPAVSHTPLARVHERSRGSRIVKAVLLVALGVAGFYGYPWIRDRIAAARGEPAATPAQLSSGSSRYRCDGRTLCMQMTSCAEAKFFAANCPKTEMDGDGDGVPCENQLCPEQ